jgi:hypothetical protein
VSRSRRGLALVLVMCALVLAACASPRNDLGSGSTACFKALPAAVTAVGHQGRYLGVRQVSAASLAKRHPEFASLGKETICVVAFQGTFGPGSVKEASPGVSGTYALVAVDAKTAKEVAAVITSRLPLRFAHFV